MPLLWVVGLVVAVKRKKFIYNIHLFMSFLKSKLFSVYYVYFLCRIFIFSREKLKSTAILFV